MKEKINQKQIDKELGVCPFTYKPRIVDKENEKVKYFIEMGQKLIKKIMEQKHIVNH